MRAPPGQRGCGGFRRSPRSPAGMAWTCARFYNARAIQGGAVVHIGLFVEELRQGEDQATSFREAFALAERADAPGHRLRLARARSTSRRPGRSSPRRCRWLARSRPGRSGCAWAPPFRSCRSTIRCGSPRRSRRSITSAAGASSSASAAAASCARTTCSGSPTPRARRASARRSRSSPRRGRASRSASRASSTSSRTSRSRRTPFQVPHPPIRMATTSDETFPAAGALGLPIFVGLRTTEIDDLQRTLAPYRQAWRDAGHRGEPSVYLRIPVYVAPTEREARGGSAREPPRVLRAADRPRAGRRRPRRRRADRSATRAGRAHGRADLRRHAGAQGGVRHAGARGRADRPAAPAARASTGSSRS